MPHLRLSLVMRSGLLAAVLGLAPSSTSAADPAALSLFEAKIRPILAEHCYACHGPRKQESQLRLDHISLMLTGGERGPAIVPGAPQKSRLLEAVGYGDEDLQMPPKNKLSAEQIAVLTQWVQQGAVWPDESVQAKVVAEETRVPIFDLQQRRAAHWSWKPVRPLPPPQVRDPTWQLNPIDAFVQAGLEQAGVRHAVPADRRTLIRRVSMDLIGLPPTPAEVEAFLDDRTADAYEKLVDRLLQSPRFGERWARHWLDLVRYAETFGHEFDYAIPHAWRYRDYVIRALNADVPYNQFVVEHIAGDLLPQPRRNPTEGFNESIIGTGFWFLGEQTHAPVDVLQHQADRIDNQIDTMTKTFLGLTVGCARCHDHKFDAISTKDYYALAGFLLSSRMQEAMLDPQGKIEKAAERIRILRKQGDAALAAVLPKLEPMSATKIARYLLASQPLVPGSGDPHILGQIVEGESLREGAVATGGEITIQKGDRWSHQRQLQWSEAKPGDKLTLQLPHLPAGPYAIYLYSPKSPDYGTFQLTIDEQRVGGPVDFSAAPVKHGETVELGTVILGAGSHRLVIDIVDLSPTQKRQIQHTVCIDYLVFRPRGAGNETAATDGRQHADTALDSTLRARWSEALQDPQVQRPDHPLNLWTRFAAGQLDPASAPAFARHRAEVAKSIAAAAEKAQQSLAKGELFEDFNKPHFEAWYPSGPAFGDAPLQPGQWDARLGGLHTTPAGVAHSGLLSPKFRGVLRSRTFILPPRIAYRVAGSGKIRLIVDGYTMDIYNSLIFDGMLRDVGVGEQFQWIVQDKYQKKYVGHRAHIEIIDAGDDWIAVDEIRFLHDSTLPEPAPAGLGVGLLADKQIANLEQLAAAYGKAICSAIERWQAGKIDAADAALVGWANEHRLLSTAPEPTAALAALTQQVRQVTVPAPINVLAIADGDGIDHPIYLRGNPSGLGDQVPRRMIEGIAGANQPALPADTSGRLQLAQRIIDPANPFISRVIVNRLWQHMTGAGIVPTVDNFGVQGQPPSNLPLLDFLADSFVKEGWSIKRTLRRIALSRTYRMSSMPEDEQAERLDPANTLMHRMSVRRLEGEAIRDSMLAVSGRLDLTMHGPSVAIHLTPFLTGRGQPDRSGPLDGAGRRSIYLEVRRNFLAPMMLAFDTPIPFQAIGRRSTSNVPAQSLLMMNDPLVVQQAQLWARRVLAANERSPEERITTMYLTAFARPPRDAEVSQALEFLQQQGERYGLPAEQRLQDVRVWSDLCHVLLNVKEFVFLR